MNWIDFVIVIIVILSVFQGFSNGLVKEVASLAGLILGIWGAIRFSSFTAAKLYEWFDMTGQYVGIISFVVTFCIIVVIVHFIGIVADKIVKAVALGFLNRLAGMVFGVLKNIIILSVIFSVLNAIDARKHFLPRSFSESRFYAPISDLVPSIFPVIGEGNFRQSFDRFKKEPETVPEPDTTIISI
jgi:membrane protein required for colicin V production